MIRRNKLKPYYCGVCGELRGNNEVIRGSELVDKKLVRSPRSAIDNRHRQADPLRCIECHQKVRIKVYPSWVSRYTNYSNKIKHQHVSKPLKCL